MMKMTRNAHAFNTHVYIRELGIISYIGLMKMVKEQENSVFLESDDVQGGGTNPGDIG